MTGYCGRLQVGKSDDPGSLRLSLRGNGVGPEPPSPSSAHLPHPQKISWNCSERFDYSPRGRGEGWAGPLANQRSGNQEGAGLLKTTWLLFPELAVLALSWTPWRDLESGAEGVGVCLCAWRRG